MSRQILDPCQRHQRGIAGFEAEAGDTPTGVPVDDAIVIRLAPQFHVRG